ncbi:hypothetical protein BDZ89DRAFT_1076648 [Hymenopellis radicata]|nr:hypothetical protein BDZ89DRAFT_1076648 [Hymenopellis radicata]
MNFFRFLCILVGWCSLARDVATTFGNPSRKRSNTSFFSPTTFDLFFRSPNACRRLEALMFCDSSRRRCHPQGQCGSLRILSQTLLRTQLCIVHTDHNAPQLSRN